MASKKPVNRSVALRVSVIASAMLLIAAFATGMIGYLLYRGSSLQYNQQVVMGIAQTAADFIEPAEYQALLLADTPAGYWYELKDYLDRVKAHTGIKYLYALDNNVDGAIRFIAEAQTPADDPALICDFGEVLAVGSYTPELFETLSTGRPGAAGAHKVERFGTMVSGYAPILDADGTVIGVIGADFDISYVLSEIHAFGVTIIGLAVLIAVLSGAALAWYIRRTVGKPIEAIIAASEKLIADDLSDIAMQARSDDEIGRLTRSFQGVVEKARHQDPLTGASNRSVGLRALERAIEATKAGVPHCSAFIDMDGLKQINDNYGHIEGDQALRIMGEALIESVRDDDIVCRYGGDEFLVVFIGCGRKAAERAMERVVAQLTQINGSGLYPYTIDFSYGLVELVPGAQEDVPEIISQMDRLMYENKRLHKQNRPRPR